MYEVPDLVKEIYRFKDGETLAQRLQDMEEKAKNMPSAGDILTKMSQRIKDETEGYREKFKQSLGECTPEECQIKMRAYDLGYFSLREIEKEIKDRDNEKIRQFTTEELKGEIVRRETKRQDDEKEMIRLKEGLKKCEDELEKRKAALSDLETKTVQ